MHAVPFLHINWRCSFSIIHSTSSSTKFMNYQPLSASYPYHDQKFAPGEPGLPLTDVDIPPFPPNSSSPARKRFRRIIWTLTALVILHLFFKFFKLFGCLLPNAPQNNFVCHLRHLTSLCWDPRIGKSCCSPKPWWNFSTFRYLRWALSLVDSSRRALGYQTFLRDHILLCPYRWYARVLYSPRG